MSASEGRWELFDSLTGEFMYGSALSASGWLVPPDVISEDGWLVWRSYDELLRNVGLRNGAAFVELLSLPMSEQPSFLPEVEAQMNEWFDSWKEVRPPSSQTEGRRLLSDFVSLHRQNDAAIAHFARRWGLLGVCPHGLIDCELCSECGPKVDADGRGREAIVGWRSCSQLGEILLVAGGRLREPHLSPGHEWPSFEEPWPFEDFRWRGLRRCPRDAAEARAWRAVVLRAWLSVEPMRLSLSDDTTPAIQLSGPLFSVLGLQLAAASFGSPGVFVCDACFMPYFPLRAPKRGFGKYCRKPECQAESRNRSRRANKQAPRSSA